MSDVDDELASASLRSEASNKLSAASHYVSIVAVPDGTGRSTVCCYADGSRPWRIGVLVAQLVIELGKYLGFEVPKNNG